MVDKIECSICCENVLSKNIVNCNCMDKTPTCVNCAKRYLLSIKNKAHCMHCKMEWNNGFLYKNFKKTWIEGSKDGQYRNYIKNISLEREKAKIPETLMVIAEEKIRKQNEENVNMLGNLRFVRSCLDRFSKNLHYNTRYGYHQPCHIDEMKEFSDTIYDFCTKMVKESSDYISTIDTNIKKFSKEISPVIDVDKGRKFVFICACPNKKCTAGLIRSDTHSCAACDTKICKRCREIIVKGEDHECNEETVETIKSMRGNTKPCPKCAAPIFKISGCDQVWCSQCKTAFSWNTGKIDTGVIHNPHAIEWRRQNGMNNRDINDIPCGGMIEFHHIDFRSIPRETEYLIEDIFINVNDANEKLAYIQVNEERYDEYRKSFINKEFSENEWKQKIFLLDRHNNRKREVIQTTQTYRDLAVEQFRHLAIDSANNNSSYNERVDIFNSFLIRMNNLRKFINNTYIETTSSYGSKSGIMHITCEWKWRTTYIK